MGCKKPKCRKYVFYSSSSSSEEEEEEGKERKGKERKGRFINIDADGEERPQYLLCTKILDLDSTKLNQRAIFKQCMMYVGKTPEFFIEN
jgi:hypothetical protein